MQVAYVAGPCRASSDWGRCRNIARAREVGRALWAMGITAIIPHSNTAFFSGPDIDESVFLEGNLELMSRCDFIVLTDRFAALHSIGTRAEVQEALRLGKKVYELKDGELLEIGVGE